jgi:lipid-binding SYLF domain-containing protein
MTSRRLAITLALALLTCRALPANAGKAAELSASSRAALKQLYAKNPSARTIGAKATAILVFPKIVKAGFMVGAQGGDGAMLRGGKVVGYYRSLAASYGFQAGVQWFGYALFFMNQAAVDQMKDTDGWEIGTGPSLVIVDDGFAKSMTTNTLTSDVYAVTFNQKGLMGGIGLQGSKITRINPK